MMLPKIINVNNQKQNYILEWGKSEAGVSRNLICIFLNTNFILKNDANSTKAKHSEH